MAKSDPGCRTGRTPYKNKRMAEQVAGFGEKAIRCENCRQWHVVPKKGRKHARN